MFEQLSNSNKKRYNYIPDIKTFIKATKRSCNFLHFSPSFFKAKLSQLPSNTIKKASISDCECCQELINRSVRITADGFHWFEQQISEFTATQIWFYSCHQLQISLNLYHFMVIIHIHVMWQFSNTLQNKPQSLKGLVFHTGKCNYMMKDKNQTDESTLTCLLVHVYYLLTHK